MMGMMGLFCHLTIRVKPGKTYLSSNRCLFSLAYTPILGWDSQGVLVTWGNALAPAVRAQGSATLASVLTGTHWSGSHHVQPFQSQGPTSAPTRGPRMVPGSLASPTNPVVG